MAMLCVCNCNKRSFAPAAEQQRSTALPWRWGPAIVEKTPSGATTSQGEENIPWVQHSELDNCMLLDVFIQNLIKINKCCNSPFSPIAYALYLNQPRAPRTSIFPST